MLWKLDGLSEYDARRPLTPTGTNVLGVIKHLAYVEAGYFGDTFGRPFPEPTTRRDLDDMDHNDDLWATAEESREDIVGLYERAWEHAQETFAAQDARHASGGCRGGRRSGPRSRCTRSWCT